MIDRRTVVALISSAATGLAATGPAGAQGSTKFARIGRLSPLSPAADELMMSGLKEGLTTFGWVEGRNLAFEFRFAAGRLEQLPGLAAELVANGVDLIVTGSNPGALAAKLATSTIPILFVTTGDPVASGLVASLARPGGNLTGVAALGQDLNPKRLQHLKEMLPELKSVAVIVLRGSPYSATFEAIAAGTAASLGIELQLVPIDGADGLDGAFEAMRARRAGALLVISEPVLLSNRHRIIDLASRHRIPTAFSERESVAAGGLMSYGASLPGLYRHLAGYVDRILRGAKPADLPVQQPTKLDLVVNLRAAKALGLALPPSMLLRADEVIE